MNKLDKKRDKHLIIILKEMCKRVKAPYKVVNSTNDWYRKYFWTEKEQEDFAKWMVDYFYNNREAREEILAFPMFKTKKRIKSAVNFFLFCYGWIIKI